MAGTGKRSVVFRNDRPNTKWIVRRITINVTGATSMSQCTVYRGPEQANNQIDFTRKGNGDTSETEVVLMPTEFLTVTWENNTNGAVATCRIEGDMMVQGNRGYGGV
jgi:hypothetical protein